MNTTENYIFEQHIKNLNTKWEDFSREIQDIQTSDTFSFLYATDIHYIRKYAMYVPVYYKLKEMVEFSKYAGFDLLALTGDIVDGNTTLKRQRRDLYDVISLVREAKTTSVLISKGNHDDCSWYAFEHNLDCEAVLSSEQWYTNVINPIRVQYPINLDESNKAGGYYYIDYPLHKIRVINLNTSDVPCVLNPDRTLVKEYCGQWNLGIQEKQLKWLSKVLEFEEAGWSVMFMSHDFLVNNDCAGQNVRNGSAAWEIICAYKNGEKGTIKSNEKYFEAEVSYDFTKNKSNDILPYMFGHVHKDIEFVQDGITAVATKNLLGTIGQKWDDQDEVVNGSWDCIFVDKNKRILKSKRYGIQGADREIKF